MNKPRTAITPTREENYAEWYQQVVRAADLAENSAVRGCMVIKPWGYSLWENMQRAMDDMFKAFVSYACGARGFGCPWCTRCRYGRGIKSSPGSHHQNGYRKSHDISTASDQRVTTRG